MCGPAPKQRRRFLFSPSAKVECAQTCSPVLAVDQCSAVGWRGGNAAGGELDHIEAKITTAGDETEVDPAEAAGGQDQEVREWRR